MVQFLQCCCSARMPASRPLFSSIVVVLLLLLTSSMDMEAAAAHSEEAITRRRFPFPHELSSSTPTPTPTKEQLQEEEAAAIVRGGRRALIGSRPPRCERACMSCGHCEAVQVPIAPQEAHHQKSAAAAAMFSYRVDGVANYKPLSWKCRCGGTILDP